MKIEKLSLKGIKNVLSREELKKIMAGSSACIPEGEGNCSDPGATCCGTLSCYPQTETCEPY